jgi:hypothetical protein
MQNQMTAIPLNGEYSLAIVHVIRGIELIVLKDGIKQACRTERRKVLETFLLEEEVHIFKGRVQLYKSGFEIFIQLKGEIVGSVYEQIFKKAISIN